MRYSKVFLEGIGYELAPNVVTSAELEERVAPVYKKLGMQAGQLEALTGIRERRWWDEGVVLSDAALVAARKVLAATRFDARELGCVVYAGVCREGNEPATACAVAAGLGVTRDCAVHDVSNACLGVLNGILDVANRIELGQIRAGLVVSCESAREINEAMIAHMRKTPTMDDFRVSMATLTGGSGAVAVLLSDGHFGGGTHRRLLGGAYKAAPEHHALCKWDRDHMMTDAAAVLKHGVALGSETWKALKWRLGWEGADKVICHQVGGPHRASILETLAIAPDRDYSTYEFLGNMGTVSLPLTAALADERGFLKAGDRVAWLGIGSGLNCLMLGWEW